MKVTSYKRMILLLLFKNIYLNDFYNHKMFCGTYPLATTLWKANLIKETLQICIRSGWKGNNSNHESLGPHDDEQATNPS